MKLAKMLLHAGRFKLERTDGAALLKELIGQFVIERDMVKVDDIAGCLLHNLAGFL